MKSKEELIQDHIDEVLSAEDQILFDEWWTADPEFREEVQFQKEIADLLSRRLTTDTQPLKATLVEAEKAYRTTPIVQWKRWVYPLLAVATLALVGRFFFFPSADPLYQLPEMRSEIVRGHENEYATRYEEAVKAFNSRHYKESTEILQDLHRTDSSVVQYTFYLGLSLLGEEKTSDATVVLQPLADGTSVFRYESAYYLAIALHQTGQIEEAKKHLATIPKDVQIYTKAQQLLDEWKK
ncbi:hypothetical protein [Sphingobacterium sp. LRF_L2]|uniref:hypothetical protein n=1 Tax=Sphingobacterium sp. LRF_L2 TaxID=3369421 RepID=UPI003F5FEFDA